MKLKTILILIAITALAGCATSAPEPPTSAAPAAEDAAVPASESTEAATDTPAAVEGTLVVLSARDEKFMEPLWDLVRSRHPKLELVIDYGKDAPYLDRLRSEREAPRADLFLTKGSAAIASAAKDGLLAPLPDELLERVPDRVRGGDGMWVGLSARARVLVVRRDLADAPSTLLDIAAPRYAGRVGRTVATNSSFVGGVATVLADVGEEGAKTFLAGLAENTKSGDLVFPKHTPTVAAVAQGQADLALVNHYYFYRNVLGKEYDPDLSADAAREKLDAAPIVAVYPTDEGGVAWNVTGGGIVAGGPNPEAAKATLRILLSDEGQQAFAWTNREYPVVDGVSAAPGVKPASEFSWSKTSLETLAANQEAAVAAIQAAGLR